MNTAEKIGLLPGFGWMAGFGFVATLLRCWSLTPTGMIVVGIVGESRLIPLSPYHQFTSFFPGDIFLGIAAAGLLVLAQSLPSADRWYSSGWWHGLVLCITLGRAVIMIAMELRKGDDPIRQFSPTQLYHSIVLWGGFGYVVIVTLVAVVAGHAWSCRLESFLVLFGLAVWIGCVVYDAVSPIGDKVQSVHVADWHPIGVTALRSLCRWRNWTW